MSLLSWILIFFIPLFILISFFFTDVSILPVVYLLFAAQTFFSLTNAKLNMDGNNLLYSILQVGIPFITFCALFLFTELTKSESLIHLISASLIAQFVVLVLSYNYSKIQWKFLNFRKILASHEFESYYKFIRPIMILPVFTWIVSSGDKYLIQWYKDSYSVGVYSAAYSIGSKVFLSLGGMIILWFNSSVYSSFSNTDDIGKCIVETKQRVLRYFILGLMIVGLIHVFSNHIGLLLLSDKYRESFKLISILAFSQLILTCYQFWEQLLFASGNTKYILYNYIIGSIINVLLNILLIPVLGVQGSAISMVICTIIQYMYLFLVVNKKLVTN
jgi:O-antigen/teichoic acid export membrane protein